MTRERQLGLALTLLLSAVCSVAQAASCADVTAAKSRTYGFRPSQLGAAERNTRSLQMDVFWNLVKGMGPDGITCLQALVEAEQADKFFLFDGASLLASLDHSGGSNQAILKALTRTNLQDVQPDAFISLALRLAKQDVDISSVADNYLHTPKVTTYLAQHGGYKLDRLQGAILLYASMSPVLVDKALSQEVQGSNDDARNTAAIVWSMNLTEESFKGLAALGDMKTFSNEARQSVQYVLKAQTVPVTKPSKYSRPQVLAKIAKLPDSDPSEFTVGFADTEAEIRPFHNSICATLTPADVVALLDARRRSIRGVSDESVDDYAELSGVLLNLINVLDLYPDFRTH
jgi:hypothetical protein